MIYAAKNAMEFVELKSLAILWEEIVCGVELFV
jgi:hypothetical protein